VNLIIHKNFSGKLISPSLRTEDWVLYIRFWLV